jgi:hypothetical protein
VTDPPASRPAPVPDPPRDPDRLAALVMALRPGLVGEMLAARFEFDQMWEQVWSVLGEDPSEDRP